MQGRWQYAWRWGGMSTMVARLAALNVVVFLLQHLLGGLRGLEFVRLFALSWEGVRHGFLWQFVTYQFLHAGFAHIFMNMVALLLIGPAAEELLGRTHLLVVYLLSGVLGGLGFVLLDPYAPCVGASGSVFGVFAALVALHPHQRMTLVLFPFVQFEAWVMAVVFGGIQLLYLVTGGGGRVAYAAHVAGGIAGFVYARVVQRRLSVPGARPWERRPLAHADRYPPRRPARPAGPDPAEVDRILDKVAREGLGSLNRREREVLEKASAERRR